MTLNKEEIQYFNLREVKATLDTIEVVVEPMNIDSHENITKDFLNKGYELDESKEMASNVMEY